MAASEKSTRSIFSDVRDTLGGLFGGKLDEKHEALVHCMFSLLGAMARSDGVVSTEEANFTNMLDGRVEISPRVRARVASRAFHHRMGARLDLDREILTLLSQYRRGSAEIIKVSPRHCFRLATADAMIRPGEQAVSSRIITLGLGVRTHRTRRASETHHELTPRERQRQAKAIISKLSVLPMKPATASWMRFSDSSCAYTMWPDS